MPKFPGSTPQPDQPATNQQTYNTPGLATYTTSTLVTGSRLYFAWSGTDSQSHLNLASTPNFLLFDGKVVLSDRALSGPALAGFDNKLYIAYEGTDYNIHIESTSDGVTFQERESLGVQTNAAPALASFGARLYLAYQDTNGNLQIMSTDGTDGGSGGPIFTAPMPLNQSSYSDTGPALNGFDGNLYLAWTGTNSGTSLNVEYSPDGVHFNHKQEFQSSYQVPALTHNGSTLWIAWTGTDGHLNTATSSGNGSSWTKTTWTTCSSFFGPALASFQSSTNIGFAGTDAHSTLNMALVPPLLC